MAETMQTVEPRTPVSDPKWIFYVARLDLETCDQIQTGYQ